MTTTRERICSILAPLCRYLAKVSTDVEFSDWGGIIAEAFEFGESDAELYTSLFARAGDEDPVTGTAHTVLAAYWGKRLGKSAMFAQQVSARGGTLHVEADFAGGRVLLTGSAVIVLSGQIDIS